MKKSRFYLSLSILNILLCLSMMGLACLLGISFFVSATVFTFGVRAAFILLAKILFLPILYVIVEKKFSNSILNEMFNELKLNVVRRKRAFLVAIIIDVVLCICYSVKQSISFLDLILNPIVYELITLGGVSLFYVSLLGFWKIRGKLK
ncbi:hypothetical protein IJE86_01235 [bacterium]|nr:hypothetical protein [bacterium]